MRVTWVLACSGVSTHYQGSAAGASESPCWTGPADCLFQEVVVKPDRARVMSEGLITGLVGYVVIVLFYGILNVFTGQSFFSTAAHLGAGLVSAARSSGAVGAVLAFNGLHIVAFLCIGLLAASARGMQTERHPSFFVLALFIGVAGLFAVMATFLSFAAKSGVELPIGSVFAANLVAGAAMGAYLLKAHPRLWAEVRDHLDPEREWSIRLRTEVLNSCRRGSSFHGCTNKWDFRWCRERIVLVAQRR